MFYNLLFTGGMVLKMCYLFDSFRYDLVCSGFVSCAFACTTKKKNWKIKMYIVQCYLFYTGFKLALPSFLPSFFVKESTPVVGKYPD